MKNIVQPNYAKETFNNCTPQKVDIFWERGKSKNEGDIFRNFWFHNKPFGTKILYILYKLESLNFGVDNQPIVLDSKFKHLAFFTHNHKTKKMFFQAIENVPI